MSSEDIDFKSIKCQHNIGDDILMRHTYNNTAIEYIYKQLRMETDLSKGSMHCQYI